MGDVRVRQFCINQDFREIPCPARPTGYTSRKIWLKLTRKLGLAYARVSTYGQTLDAQLEQLRGAGCTKIYREKVTGAHSDRRQLLKMLDTLTPCDVVTVTRIDRIAGEIGEKFCHQTAAFQLGHSGTQYRPAVFNDRDDTALRIKAGLQLRQLFVAHQHDEMGL